MNITTVASGLAVNLVAIGILVLVYRRRHSKSDLVLSYVTINLGVFCAVALLARADGGMALGMGLFGILSIIRLRSSAISQTEVAYYFVALVLGLVTALGGQWPALTGGISALLVLVLAALDRGERAVLRTPTERQRIVLDVVHRDEDALRDDLAARLRRPILGVSIEEVDYVRDVTVCVVEVTHNNDEVRLPTDEYTLEDRRYAGAQGARNGGAS